VVGHKISVLTEPITRTLDLNDDGVVKQAIEECGGDNEIAEDLAPFCEAMVRGEAKRRVVHRGPAIRPCKTTLFMLYLL